MELQSILTAIRNLPGIDDTSEPKLEERERETGVIRKRLATLMRDSPVVTAFVGENIRLFNGTRGIPQSFDLLDELLNEQAYRLASWEVASEEINYRRFFDNNELAAIRMEEASVFHDSHQMVFQLLRDGVVVGLRIDHVDGLAVGAERLAVTFGGVFIISALIGVLNNGLEDKLKELRSVVPANRQRYRQPLPDEWSDPVLSTAALQRLLVKGLVTAEWGQSENNRRARFYRLTPAGRRQLGLDETSFLEHFEAIRKILRARS